MANKKQPILVFDVDDTIVNFVGHLCSLHNRLKNTCLYETDIKEWDFNNIQIKDARGNVVLGTELKDTFHKYEPHGLYAQLPLLPDARHALNIIKKLGYRIILMTARKDEYREATKLNMIMHELPIDVENDIYFSRDKSKDIKELSKRFQVVAFADDKAETVRDVFENCHVKHVFLVNKNHNKNEEVDPEIQRIDNIFEITRILREVK